MPNDKQTPQEQAFFDRLNSLADTVKGTKNLHDNPDMTLLFTVSVYKNALDPTMHATQISLEFDFPLEVIGLELMQVALRLIESQGESK